MSWSTRVGSWVRSRPVAPVGSPRLARVVDNVDPSGLGRVLIELAGESKRPVTQWARVATLRAGPDRGTWFLPEVDDEVLVAFEGGDAGHPIVLGSLWGEHARPPQAGSSRCTIVTRSGAQITIDDSDGNSVVELRTGGGRHVTLDDHRSTITVSDGAGNSVVAGAEGLTVSAVGDVTVSATRVTVNATTIEVAAAMVDVSGVVKCDTMIANTVVASTYTPGAGNLQ